MSDLVLNPMFLAACVAIILSPGPDILYVVAKGMSQGRLSAIVAAAGFTSGLSIHTALAACGLSALLMASAVAFTCVKIAGGAYLVDLGIRAGGSRGLISLPVSGNRPGPRRIFAQAFLMNVLNPKVAVFFLAFIPQFTRPALGNLPGQFLLLGFCFAVLSFLVFSLVGLFGSSLGGWISARPKVARLLDRTVGSIFIGLGIRLGRVGVR